MICEPDHGRHTLVDDCKADACQRIQALVDICWYYALSNDFP